MKKHLVVATGLALLSTSAYATKARMEALGQHTIRGSHYISDSRNIFGNPADLNEMKNYVVTEFGEDSSTATPEPQGGFFREVGSFAYGFYLGFEDEDTYSAARTTAGYKSQDNTLDFFFAGDMGIQWGARLHYASVSDEAVTGASSTTIKAENSTLGLGLGVNAGPISLEANVGVKDESEGRTAGLAGDKWENETSFDIVGKYKIGAITTFAEYYKNGYQDKRSGTVTTKQEDSKMVLGLGHIHEVTSTSRVFTDASLSIVEGKTTASGTVSADTKVTTLPLTIGFEAEAKSWLTLRGSVQQNVFLGSSKNELNGGKATSIANSTNISAGATLNFGKLKVDGVIGKEDVGTTPDEQGSLRTDRLLTKVSVHYWF